jgi:RHS repeat-associated protein
LTLATLAVPPRKNQAAKEEKKTFHALAACAAARGPVRAVARSGGLNCVRVLAYAYTRERECVSTKNSLDSRRSVFINTAQTRTASREIGHAYGKRASSVMYATWRRESDPFGTLLGNSAPNENPQIITGTATQIQAATFIYDEMFPGQHRDRESGKFYNYFRDYDASVGRYMQGDPLGLEGDENAFEYVGSDPLGYNDFFGEKRSRPGVPRYRKPPKPEKPKYDPPPQPPNDRSNQQDKFNQMFRPDKDDQWFYCLQWYCPQPDRCTRRDYLSPNDWLPPATNPDTPPDGCTCTSKVLMASGPRAPGSDFTDVPLPRPRPPKGRK